MKEIGHPNALPQSAPTRRPTALASEGSGLTRTATANRSSPLRGMSRLRRIGRALTNPAHHPAPSIDSDVTSGSSGSGEKPQRSATAAGIDRPGELTTDPHAGHADRIRLGATTSPGDRRAGVAPFRSPAHRAAFPDQWPLRWPRGTLPIGLRRNAVSHRHSGNVAARNNMEPR